MTIAFACILFMGILPIVCAGIAKKGFDGYDNSRPREWLAKQTGFRARANAAQANTFESLPLFFAAVIIASFIHAPQGRIDLFAVAFVIARCLYVLCYLADWPTLRTVAWTLGLMSILAIFLQI